MIQTSTSSKIYADSLMKINLREDEVMSDLSLVSETTAKSKDLSSVIYNPSINNNIKFEIIDEIFKDKIQKEILSFIKILIEKNRFQELESIINAYQSLCDIKNNTKRAKVVSAIELNDKYKKDIINKLQEKYETKIIPEWEINENIIGGLIMQIDDTIIDNSLKRKLEKISRI